VGVIFRTPKTNSVLIMLSGDGPATLTTVIPASHDSQKVTWDTERALDVRPVVPLSHYN
jgi:hypothetical protein